MTPEKNTPGPNTAIRNYPNLLRRYAHLLELTRVLTSTLQIEEVYAQVVDGTTTLLECESAALFLVDPTSGDLHIAFTSKMDPAVDRRHAVPRKSSLAEQVLESGNPSLADSRTETQKSAFFEWTGLSGLQPHSLLAIPMKSKGSMVGVLEAINKLDGTFQSDDFATLEAFASQAAATIENLRLLRQSDLIAEMVHEIRTPLAALNTASSLLDRQDLSDNQRHSVLSTFRQEILRLNQLADDYLDLARLESGRVRLQLERFSAAALLSECAEIVSPLINAQGLRFRQEVQRDSLDLVADRTKIKQVVLNLLSNAVKYNNPGGEISLRGFRKSSTAGEIRETICFEVTDTGRGIPPESLPHMFERYYRVQEGSGLSRGTGLGLYIANYIIESHHGLIEVESQPGQGSTFRVCLPSVPPSGRSTGPLAKDQN